MDIKDLATQNFDEVELPQMYKIKQALYSKKLIDIPGEVKKLLAEEELENKVLPGSKIGVAVGSRGIDSLMIIIKEIIDYLIDLGARPFIIPAMGTHGGATARGQKEVLADYNISEESLGVPVVSSMETELIGKTDSNVPIYFSKIGLEADGIIVVNRIKVHTDFSGDIESGLSKMLVIGLGKQKGASSVHSMGVDKFPELIPEAAKLIIAKAPVLLGVGLLENAYSEISEIKTAQAAEILKLDKKMLIKQKEIMPGLPFKELDVLIIDEMGKNISGAGMDTNVIGKFDNKINIKYIAVLSLTPESHGNATGIGLADFTTLNCFNSIDFSDTYINCLTSKMVNYAKIPLVLKNQETAIKVAIKFVNKDNRTIKVARIKNTSSLSEFYISEGLLDEAESNEDIKLLENNKS